MDNDQARIRLAEAMGWSFPEGPMLSAVPPGGTGAGDVTAIPDPFTDANDDYAVLEWMREQRFSRRTRFWDEFNDIVSVQTRYRLAWPDAMQFYQPGDYARAALKVLESA